MEGIRKKPDSGPGTLASTSDKSSGVKSASTPSTPLAESVNIHTESRHSHSAPTGSTPSGEHLSEVRQDGDVPVDNFLGQETPLKNVLPSVAAMLRSSDSSDWIRATNWFFELLSRDQSPPAIKEVIRCGVIPVLIFLLTMENQSQELKEVAAKVLLHIAVGVSTDKNFCVDSIQLDSAQTALVLLASSDDKEVLHHTWDAFGVISCLAHVNLYELIFQPYLFPRLRGFFHHESASVVIGALRTLGNHMRVNKDVIELGCLDKRITSASLDALENILKCGERLNFGGDGDVNPYAARMYDIGAWELLDDFHPLYDYENFVKALDLLNRYCVEPVYARGPEFK